MAELRRHVAALAALAAIAAALVLAGMLSPPARAGVTDLTVSAAWGGPQAAVGIPTEIQYTINNSDGPKLYDFGFGDTLPKGVQVYNTGTGTVANCLSDNTASNSAGASTITVSDVTVPAGSTSCKITFEVEGTSTGPSGSDALGSLTYSRNSHGSSPEHAATLNDAGSLQILADPVVNWTVPTAHATYAYGRVVHADYSCTEAGFTGTFESCYGYDDRGNKIDSGDCLDTLDPGSHSLVVQELNAIATGHASISYRVQTLALRSVRTSRGGPVRYSVRLPLAGRLETLLLKGRELLGRLSTTVKHAGSVRPTVRLSAAGRRLVAAAGRRGVRVSLRVSFTPKPSAVAASACFAAISPATATATKSGIRLR